MPKTNLQQKGSFYERVIQEAKKSPHSEKYGKVCTSLEQLMNITNDLQASNKAMTAQEYDSLMNAYKDVITDCTSYFEESEKFTSYEKNRSGIIKEINSLLSKDIKVLNSCDKQNPGTLSSIVEQSRRHVVELDNLNIAAAGGKMNSRIPLKTSNNKKGFFTADQTYNNDKEWEKVINEHSKRLGEIDNNVPNILKECLSDPNKKRVMISKLPVLDFDINDPEEAVGYMMDFLDYMHLEDCYEDHDSLKAVYDFCVAIDPVANKDQVMGKAGIKKDSNISDRNCSMSTVAKLLKCEHLIASSTPLKIKVDGNEINGVFMETVDGSDLCNIQENDPLLEADADSFESPDVFEQLADLQVLDYICGNIDRHCGNIIYNFKTDENGKQKLASIKGIDNDTSFGTPAANQGNVHLMVHPNNMKFITRNMAVALSNLTPDMLRASLMNSKLSKDEIEAACQRLRDVKNAFIAHSIRTMSKEELSKTNVNELSRGNNYFTNYAALQENCKNKKYNAYPKKNAYTYLEDKYSEANVLLDKQPILAKLREAMENSKAAIYDTSEYKAMKKHFENVERITKEIKDTYPDSKDIPENRISELKNAYLELADKSEKYIELKKLVPTYARGQKRLDFAKELNSLAIDTCNEFSIEKDAVAENDMELEEPNDELVM